MDELDEISRLRSILEEERKKNEILVQELKETKELQFRLAKESESEEEKISNFLLRKIDALKDEKKRIIRECEEEEEFLINSLQRKLEQVVNFFSGFILFHI
jgi:adenine-specific DNA methylase